MDVSLLQRRKHLVAVEVCQWVGWCGIQLKKYQ